MKNHNVGLKVLAACVFGFLSWSGSVSTVVNAHELDGWDQSGSAPRGVVLKVDAHGVAAWTALPLSDPQDFQNGLVAQSPAWKAQVESWIGERAVSGQGAVHPSVLPSELDEGTSTDAWCFYQPYWGARSWHTYHWQAWTRGPGFYSSYVRWSNYQYFPAAHWSWNSSYYYYYQFRF